MVLKKQEKEHCTLEERAEKYGGKLGPYEEFDWGDPIGREQYC
jgi:antitoxin MazE